MLPLFPITLAAAALFAPAVAGAAEPQARALQPLMAAEVAAGAPGVTAYVDDGHRVWQGAAGVADVRTGRRLRPTDRFRAGSNTKSMVSTVVLQLVGEHRLALTDTVARRLGPVLPYANRVTVRNLLNHTSGIPDNATPPAVELFKGDPFRRWRPEELVALVADLPQEFPAGSAWNYSNTNYTLLGMMVERSTGHTLAQEVERRILRPLGLRDSSMPLHEPTPSGSFARGYSLDYDDEYNQIPETLRDVTAHDSSGYFAAGNLVTTEADLARFFRALLSGRLLSPALLAEMKTTVPTSYGPGIRYGLGLFFFDDTPCGTLIGHGGGMPGYENQFASTPDGRHQVGIMRNYEEAPDAVTEAQGTLWSKAMELACAA
ncbi:beta-lactamase family protein [Solirubrobacter ginsenosidimutans]|uniref:Beta-lactamase family protein n=1 Tax=Solirubrobacter ginsenosidimutans TaxID=490573 RepID=A0A9X3MU34_9ACTN|nr:serine hydrolase domain-containing protein [Solirubrobacter ginsenosidimutans]MDA0163056.1 beta-lactamase family protein [Solirubrobacter ginsenosidimutans]